MVERIQWKKKFYRGIERLAIGRHREFSWAEPIPLSERILIHRRTATSIENSYG